MAKPYLAPSLAKLRAEINAAWPKRDKTSDGWIGDAAHSARVSQHNPDERGCVRALDVDVDGIDAKAILKKVIGDARVWYVIYNRVIWSRTNGWEPRAYKGANPHTGHFHVSILLTEEAEKDARGWGVSAPAAAKKPAPKPAAKPAPEADADGWKPVKLDRDVRPGARHPQVRILQASLVKLGYRIRGAVTSFYGPQTQKAVAAWHQDHREFSTGGYDPEIGPKGFEELQRQAREA